ncbi:hypothetical protein OA39_05093 [Vibrio campbellii]|uniref:hypothetical protein n=1 Tax=Vibrio campbellii TaxID=680 RepID=UPI0005318E3B|nr:hypothetical protein [Vibrio campbellii]KGR32565.1 hypothetical protein OA39_05093 [Vibrio campbellii]
MTETTSSTSIPEPSLGEDLSDGQAPTNDVDLLQHYRDENKTYLTFKKWVFGIILVCAITFLVVGLYQAATAVSHLISTQKSTIALINGELKKEECEKNSGTACEYTLVAKPAPKLSAAKPNSDKKDTTQVQTEISGKKTVVTTTSSQTVAKDSKKKESSIVSQIVEQVWVLTGSVITLIVLILAVGLTLLLTITKHVFSPREPRSEDSQGTFDSLTTPIGSVIEGILEALKKRFQ